MRINAVKMCKFCGSMVDILIEPDDLDNMSMYNIDKISYLTNSEKHLLKYGECESCVEAASSELNDGLDNGVWEELNG